MSIDGTAVVLSVLQRADLSTNCVTQVENAKLPPLISLDQDNIWPIDTLYFFLYFMMARRWTLNNPKQEGKLDKNRRIWLGRMTGSFQVDCSIKN